ncbi:MAG: phosphoenolpyruvate--protein phosphotransferase [Phycisphaeraceae bacterium]|nr:phosphoenolpyruvate--protein phosphotransferase [Phycisphaeraceae bacterium]
MESIKGIAVSPGVIIGRVFILDDEHARIARRTVPPEATGREIQRLDAAMDRSVVELAQLKDQTRVELGEEAAKIFAFHLGMLCDPSLTTPMKAMIQTQRVTAEYAAWRTMADLAHRFESMPNVAFKTKVDDVRDLSSRVLRHLIGEHSSRLKDLDHRAVVVARDLTPSQAAMFDRSHVIGFATDFGGPTSHTAIFARALGIPAVVGCGTITDLASDGTPIVIDGDRGVVILDPTEEQIAEYTSTIEQQKLFRLTLADLSSLPSVTRDGVDIELLANIEFPEEVPIAVDCGATGVGLYRTEYLYLTSTREPTETDHYEAYAKAVSLLGGRTLTIRTVDLGADKYTQQRAQTPERNPFLGLRSIRYCLQSLPMFRTQLRAILRASAHGPIKIMFPLITTVGELRQAKFLLNDVMEDLDEEGIAYDRNVPVGMMVEVPAAALMADTFARESEFFSIGTNDLVQYTLAVDRTNERVAAMYNPAHPAVIQLIQMVVKAARSARGHAHQGSGPGIPVSCCGESAGDLGFAMLLIGLGLRTLSVTSSSIPPLKRLVRSVTVANCEEIAEKALSLDSDTAVAAFLRNQARKTLPEAFDGRSAEY